MSFDARSNVLRLCCGTGCHPAPASLGGREDCLWEADPTLHWVEGGVAALGAIPLPLPWGSGGSASRRQIPHSNEWRVKWCGTEAILYAASVVG
jgi:hypothetical protein